MLIGYNNDVDHRGKTFHIQTEDRGANDQCIETQLFHGGAILDTKITSYDDIVEGLEGEQRDQKIRSVMKASHRSLFKNLLAGKYDEQVGLEPKEKSDEELRELFQEKVQDFQPGQDRVPDAAVELEEEGMEALEQEAQMEGFEDPSQEDHMGINQLKDKLDDIDEPEEEGVEEVEETDIDLGAGAEPSEAAAAPEETDEPEESGEPDTSIIDPPKEIPEVQEQQSAGENESAAEEDVSVRADTDKLDTVQVDPDELDTDKLDTDKLESLDRSLSRREEEMESEAGVEDVETGVEAWTGCEEPDEDLSITELVEAYMAG